MDNATVVARLQEQFGDTITVLADARSGEACIGVPPSHIVAVAQFLRDDSALAYNALENLCGVDYLGRTPRFEVVYHRTTYEIEVAARAITEAGLPPNLADRLARGS